MALHVQSSVATAIYQYNKPSLPASVKAYWDCGELPSDLTGVTQLDDQSGNGWHLSFGASAPTLHTASDGRQALDFVAATTTRLATVQVGGQNFFATVTPAHNWCMILVMSSANVGANVGNLMGTSFSDRVIQSRTNDGLRYSENTGPLDIASCWYRGLDNRGVIAAYRLSGVGTIANSMAATNWHNSNMVLGTVLGRTISGTPPTTPSPNTSLRINEATHGMRLWGAIYLTNCTEQDVKDAIGWAHNQWTLPVGNNPLFLYQGDSTVSVADPTKEPGWANVLHSNELSAAFGQNHAAGGRRAENLLVAGTGGEYSIYSVVAQHFAYTGRPIFYPLCIGTNDLDSAPRTTAQVIADCEAWAAAVRAYGNNVFPVWLQCGFNHRGPSHADQHVVVSRGIRDAVVAETSNFLAAIDTLEDDSIWDWDLDVDETTQPIYMLDQTHPTIAGNADIADKWGPDFEELAIDTTAPNLETATITDAGEGLTLVFDEYVTGNAGFTLTATGGAVTATYASGDGTTTLVYTLSRTVASDEVITLDYTPGDVEDMSGNALAAISDRAVGNGGNQRLRPLSIGIGIGI